jgi:hypothetical protein
VPATISIPSFDDDKENDDCYSCCSYRSCSFCSCSSVFSITHASQYYVDRTKIRKKYIKLSIGADVLQEIICTIKIRRAPTLHDNVDFRPVITKTSNMFPLSVAVAADKGYDTEENHALVREELHALSLIPARYERVPIWRTHGRYRK